MSPTHLDDFQGTERFDVRRRLGAGGMGVVYEAFDRERDQKVALKTILHLDASTLYRFKSEFRNVAELSHPNLVRLYELFSEGGVWFYTMELINGVDFLEFVCPGVTLPEDDPLTHQSDSLDASHSLQTDEFAGKSMSTEPGTGVLREGPEPATTQKLSGTGSTVPGLPPSGETDPDFSLGPPAGRGPSGAEPATTVPAGAPSVSFQTTERALDLAPPPDPVTGREPATSPPGPAAGAARPPHVVRLKAALRQIAEVLNELHAQGRLHRDIKPSNVLVTRRGRVALLDFGLSTVIESESDRQTTDGKIVGTVSYMAPEQASGKELTPAADWYSVGVMLYRALTGRLPFSGKPLDVLLSKQTSEPPAPSTLVAGVPPDLDALCVDLLRLRPEDRPGGEDVLRRLGSTPTGAARLGSQARPFVGRSAQLSALRESFGALGRGKATAAFVSGRSGVGKSACVQRFLDGLVDRGEAVVLSGRCYEQESVAYKALDTLIDALTRFLKRLSRLEAEALMPRDVSTLARVFPVLRRVEAVADAPLRGVEIPDQQELRRRAFAALREMLVRIGDRRPLVLAIDDLQWGDLDSAALLTDLLRPPDPPVLMLLCSYRREDAETSPCLRTILGSSADVPVLRDRREIVVEPLTVGEGRALAVALIGQDDPPARAVAEMVAREAGGNPFFVYELVQYLKQGGDLEDSMLAASSELSLEAVLWRRVTHLPSEARELLEVVALAGRPLRQAVACRAAGQGADGFSSLALLRANHLIRGTGPGMLDDVETYHDRIRETVVARLDAAGRARWHAGLARELEATGDADPEALAVHFEGAGSPEKAGSYSGRAADNAADSLAFARAAKLYRRALELRPADDAEGHRLRVRLGDALANAGRSYDAALAYRQAAAGAAAEPEQLDLQRRAAYQFLIGGHIDEGLAAFATILGRLGMPLPDTPRRALLRLLLSRARLRLRGLHFRERDASEIDPRRLELIDVSRSVAVGISVVDVIRGSDYQTRSLLLALEAGEPFRIVLALGWEAVHSACDGRASRRRTSRLIATSEALAERVDHPHALGMARLSSGAARYLEGHFRVGLERLDRAEAILREQCTGVIWELDTARIFGLWALFYLGRLAELSARCDRLFREARDRGDRYLEATPGPFVGPVVRLADDDVAAARATAEAALGSWSQRGFHIQHLCHYYGSLYTDLYAGDAAGAWERIRQTAPLIDSSLLLRIQHVRADVYQHGGRAAVAAAAAAAPGDRGPFLRQAERYARRLDRERTRWTAALARLIRSGAAAVGGDPEAAARGLREAIGLCDDAEVGLFSASARRHLGLLLGGDEGRELVKHADDWMRDQGVVNPARMAACMAPGFPEIG
jgi:tetratricopeptide (TPR) repeat protein